MTLLLVNAMPHGEVDWVCAISLSLSSATFLTIMQAVSITSRLGMNEPTDNLQLPL